MVTRYLRGQWCFVECQTAKLCGAPAKSNKRGSEKTLRKDIRFRGTMPAYWNAKSGRGVFLSRKLKGAARRKRGEQTEEVREGKKREGGRKGEAE